MKARTAVLIRGPDRWRIVGEQGSSDVADDMSPAGVADEVAGHVGPRGKVIIAADSPACFFVRIPGDGSVDVRDRVAMTYELENDLPLDAESIVADFRVDDQGVAAIATDSDQWKTWIDAIEAAGVRVQSVVPAAVLAAESIMASDGWKTRRDGDVADLWLIDGDACDRIWIGRRGIVDWRHFAADPTSMDRQRRVHPPSDDAITLDSTETSEHVISGAWTRLRSAGRLGFDLRRGALAPADRLRDAETGLGIFFLAATLALVAVSVGSWWRVTRIDAAIVEIQDQQRRLFAEVFPDARVPAAPLRRVRSEHVRAISSRGLAINRGRDGEIRPPVSAARVIKRFLGGLPDDVPFRVTQIDLENGKLSIDADVRSPLDAGRLAMSLAAAGFEVPPPVTTRKDERTFQVSIRANWIAGREGDL